MRHTSFMTAGVPGAGVVRIRAGSAVAAGCRPIRSTIGRSQVTGKWYGTVDFGARATTVDGDEARFQRYPRSAVRRLCHQRWWPDAAPQDWTLEAQAWNIGYRDQRYQLDLQRVGRLTASFLWDQIPMFISRDTRTLYTQTASGRVPHRGLDAAGRSRSGAQDAARFRRPGGAVRPADAAQDRPGRHRVQRHARSGSRDPGQQHQPRGHRFPFGATFGFNNAVELPVPVKTSTTDMRDAARVGQRPRHAAVRLGRLDVRQRRRQRDLGQPAPLRSRHRRARRRRAAWRCGRAIR